MSRHGRSPRSTRIAAAFVVAILSLASVLGCSGKKATNPDPGGPASYRGSVTGSGTSGRLDITISTSPMAPQQAGFRATDGVTATGTLVLTGGGGTVALSGTWDDETDILGLTGGGWTLSGGLTSFGMEGLFSGPGPVAGVYSVQTQGIGADTVTVYLGTFTTSSGGDNGVFNIALRGSALHGHAVADGGTVVPLGGTYTAATSSLTIVHASGGAPLGTGTVHPNGTADGDYSFEAGNSGTWAGAKQP